MELAKDLQMLSKKAVIEYERELEEIVDSNCREIRRIERTLKCSLPINHHFFLNSSSQVNNSL